MRPIYHPPAATITVEGILYALSDSVRAQMMIEMIAAACPQTCSKFLQMKSRPIAKSTLSQHFKILREAGLVRSERKGVEIHNTLRCEEMTPAIKTLIETILTAYAEQHALENEPANEPAVARA